MGIWGEEPLAELKRMAVVRSFEGTALGFFYLTLETTTNTSTGDSEVGDGQTISGQDSEAVEFDALVERSKWARSVPYVP